MTAKSLTGNDFGILSTTAAHSLACVWRPAEVGRYNGGIQAGLSDGRC